jgi:hypothetical protein
LTAWTAPVVHAVGDILALNDWNNLANDTLFLYQGAYALVFNSSGTTLSGTPTQVTLGGTTALGYNFSVSSNNLVVPLTGLYQVEGTVTHAANSGSSTEYTAAYAYHNGSEVLSGGVSPTYTTYAGSAFSGLVLASANDTIGLWAFSSQSGATTETGAGNTYLHAFFVGSQ